MLFSEIAQDPLMQQVAESPKLYIYAQHLQTLVREEEEKYKAFLNQITEDDKAEFIGGEVVIHSPVMLRHNNASGNFYTLLKHYVAKHKLGYVGHEKLLIRLTRNAYEPDVCFWNKAKADTFIPNQLQFPAPDLVVEVLSTSTAANDRGVKMEDYAAHGVDEYWIVDPDAETLEQYQLQHGTYQLVIKSHTERVHSLQVQGFAIPIRAVFDEAENLAALQEIMEG